MPKRKAPMTVAEVAKLKAGNHRVGGVAGLTLQVTKTGGGRSWTLRYTDATGNRREVGIGSAFDIPLAMARDKALQLRQRLKLDGEDPIQAKQQQRLTAIAQAVASVTFSEAVVAYLKDQVGTWGNEKHEQQFVNTLRTYAEPTLGPMAVEAIEPAHVADAVRPIWSEKAETARRVRQRIEAVIAHADIRAKRARPNPAALAPMLKGNLLSKGARAVEHHAAMAWADLPAFLPRLRAANGIGTKALQFAIYTAARTGEVRGATWGEIDLDAAVWTIPAGRMKANKEHQVPLVPAALALLGERGEPDELLFPGTGGKQASDMTLAAVLKRLDVDCTVHGMRAAFKSWGGDKGKDRELVEAALAHQIGNAVEQAYNRTTLLERRRELMTDWAAMLG